MLLNSFLSAWHALMQVLAIVFFAAGFILYLIYQIRVFLIKDFREKYEFIKANEIKWIKWVFYLFSLGVAMIVNMYGATEVTEMGVWFFVRAFVSVAGATLVWYVASTVLNFQYPTVLHSKLRRWRYEPRINPETGNEMQVFNEGEVYVRLLADGKSGGQVRSVDYDVWTDIGSGAIQIEEYDSRKISLLCRNCAHYTMKVVDEEIVLPETEGAAEELLRNYRCTYCKNVRATQFYISNKTEEDYKNEKPSKLRRTQEIDAIKIEIHSALLGKQFHEFETVEQAQNFLEQL